MFLDVIKCALSVNDKTKNWMKGIVKCLGTKWFSWTFRNENKLY